MRLKGRRCLITGGSRGLGRAMCEAFARHGARVGFTYSRNDDDAEATRAALVGLGCEPLVFRGSVADSAHVKSTMKAVIDAWDGIDALVNNAGMTQVLPIGLLEEEDWDAVMDVHAKGSYLFSRAALRPMIRARSGHILNIGSFASERIIEAPVHYAAAKAALRGFTEALAREVGRYNINVNLLAPGLLDVGLAQMLPKHRIDEYLGQCPQGRLGTAAEVAELASFLISEENSFMAGAKIVVDGGAVMDLDQIMREGFDDYRQFVNPLVSLRARLLGEPADAVYAEGGLLAHRGRDGTRLVEDFHGTQSFGHRNPEITEAVKTYLESDAINWFPSRVNPFAGSLARRLCERAGGPYDNVFFANSGAGAVEAALKLARAATGKPRILSLEGAYHGCTMGACALMQKGMFRDLFEPHLPAVDALPFGDIDALAKAMAGGDVAGVIVEPIQLEGGVNHLPGAYVEALCELTAEHGALLVADEIQTGLGRTGRFLASEVWPRRPDAVVLGKHLGGGLVPISGMLTRRALFEAAYGRDYASGEAHNTTFGGNALVCVAAHAALDLLTDEVIARNGELGARIRGRLREQLSGHELFDEVRGEGMLIGIALRPTDHPWLSFEHFGVDALGDKPTVGVLMCYRLYKRGYYCFVCGHQWGVLRLLPRFNIEEARLDEFVNAASEELAHLCSLT